MKVLLLTLLQFFFIGGFSFTLPNGYPSGLNGFPNNLLNVLPNSFSKGIFGGMPSAVMSVPPGMRNMPAMSIVEANSTKGQQNNTCCFGQTCLSPCPIPGGSILPMPMHVPMGMPAAPPPVVVPARTYYEPIVHNHPPLHKIKKIIRQDRERKRKRHRSYDSSADCSEADIDADSDSSLQADSAIDYYDDVINVKV